MNTSEVETLFARTLLGEYEGDDAWAAITALRQDGSGETFERAAAWCLSDDPLKRDRAVAILCQLRRASSTNAPPAHPEWMFRDESYSLVTKLLENEHDPVVLDSAISALGHLCDARAIPLIRGFEDHRDDKVRFAVAFALGCFPNDTQAVDGLLKLTSDREADVRDWAVFGLGVQGDADSTEIPESLIRSLDDENENVREEAAVALGKRRDLRLVPSLMLMLDQPGLKVRVADAAAALLGMDHDPEWTAADYKAALRGAG